jgi:hypothetical protein
MDDARDTRAFRLAPKVHVCFEPEGAVVLDLERDAYLGLNADQVRALSMLVEGWPSATHTRAPDPDQALAFAELLRTRGLLVRAVDGGNAYEALTLACAEEELVPWDTALPRGIRAHHVWRFALSVCATALRMRRQPLLALVEGHRRRKATAMQYPATEVHSSQTLVSAFLNLRVWMYRRRERCLFDTLVLLDFLARYGVFPSWVIGVRSVPFAAHSWVQHERAVFNGTPEFVRGYTAILVT